MKMPFLHKKRQEPEQRNLTLSQACTYDMFGPIGFTSELATRVTPQSALTSTAVYAAVSIIATAISTLPIHVRDRRTGQTLTEHHLNRLFDEPNDSMTWPDFVECFMLNLLTTGNGFAFVHRNRSSIPTEIFPLKSLDTRIVHTAEGIVYNTTIGGNVPFAITPTEMIHARNMSWNGVEGISPIKAGSRAIGLSMALDDFAEKFFVNGANVGSVVELPHMSQDALDEFRRRWKQEYQGVANAHKTAAAPGLKVHRMGATPRDSQADEQRKFQLSEVARIYQIPPHMLGDLERATFSNIEEQRRQFAEDTLRRWVVKFEHAMEKTLLSSRDKGGVSIRLNIAARIRGTFKEQIEAVMQATAGAPVYTPNEARDYLGLQPIEGGDTLMSNLNQSPASQRAALRSAVTYVSNSLARKEANALWKAAKKYDGDAEAFRAWADEFYENHRQLLESALHGADNMEEPINALIERQRQKAIAAFAENDIETRANEVQSETPQEILDRIGA